MSQGRGWTDMRPFLLAASLVVTLMLSSAAPAFAAEDSLPDRVEDLEQELSSLTEEIEDLQEPIAEFDLYDQCMFLIGVTQYGTRDGRRGYYYGRGGRRRWPALAMDIRGFGLPKYQFLAFPQEEPPSIECNEDAGQEETDG